MKKCLTTVLLTIIAVVFYKCGIPQVFSKVHDELKPTESYFNLNPVCSQLIGEIYDCWLVYDRAAAVDKYLCYHYNQKLIEKIESSKTCFIGLKSADIIKLFGTPSIEEKNVLHYELGKTCKEVNLPASGSHFIKFQIDWRTEADTVVAVKIQEKHFED